MDDLVTLYNGYRTSEKLFDQVFNQIHILSQENLGALWDLIEKCKNHNHKIQPNIHGDTEQLFKEKGLMAMNGTIPLSVKLIVLKSTEGEDSFSLSIKQRGLVIKKQFNKRFGQRIIK